MEDIKQKAKEFIDEAIKDYMIPETNSGCSVEDACKLYLAGIRVGFIQGAQFGYDKGVKK